jgi:hypothetical protein
MDNIIRFPSRPRTPMGRPEPQLPQITPRDITLARAERIRARTERRRRPRRFPGWTLFVSGFLFARIIDAIRAATQ